MKSLKIGFYMIVVLKDGTEFGGRIESVDGLNVVLSGCSDETEGVEYRTVDLSSVAYYDTSEYAESLLS